jgi:hypothetical protein
VCLGLGVTPWLTHRERRSVALVRSDDRAFDSGRRGESAVVSRDRRSTDTRSTSLNSPVTPRLLPAHYGLAMELAGRLHQLTAAELAPVVKKALHDDHAWPLTWEFDALDWTGNPATVGLFRLAGIARTSGGGEVPWIVVLKVVADVDLTGDPLVDRYTHEPEGINYWKREALAFNSGLLIGWPGPLVPVHCYGVEEVSKSQA